MDVKTIGLIGAGHIGSQLVRFGRGERRQLGYKSLKYLSAITVVDSLKDIGKGSGSIAPELGYSWYAGI